MNKNQVIRPAQKSSTVPNIRTQPRLRGINVTLQLKKGHVRWLTELALKEFHWENSLELFNLVQRVLGELVRDRICTLKKNIPSLGKISCSDTIDAVLNNWPEAIPRTRGQRREILLCIAAHIVRHLETSIYKKVINDASKEEVASLGLTPALKAVAINTLDASIRADNLFIRFLARFNSFPNYPNCEELLKLGASFSHFYIPYDKKLYTLNELFPRDAQFISRKFKEIACLHVNWDKLHGGRTFKRYLLALSSAYRETNTRKINQRYKSVSDRFTELAWSSFPILVIPPAYFEGGYERPPYHDPEIRVGLSSFECAQIEREVIPIQRAMGFLLSKEGFEEPAFILQARKVRVINSIGDFGVNLKSKSVGQCGTSIIIAYLGEHIKAYEEMRRGKAFHVEGVNKEKRNIMSFFCSIFHEFGHLHIDGRDPSISRLGQRAAGIIQEIEAEQIYRWMIPKLIDMKKLRGSKREWAAILIEISLLEMLDKSKERDPEYFYSSAFILNKLFSEGVLEMTKKAGELSIINIADFYRIQEEQAKEVLSLFEDKSINDVKARKWVKSRCKPNRILCEYLDNIAKRNP